eukprot:1073-Prymnesium_polylepis.1
MLPDQGDLMARCRLLVRSALHAIFWLEMLSAGVWLRGLHEIYAKRKTNSNPRWGRGGRSRTCHPRKRPVAEPAVARPVASRLAASRRWPAGRGQRRRGRRCNRPQLLKTEMDALMLLTCSWGPCRAPPAPSASSPCKPGSRGLKTVRTRAAGG